MKLTKEIEKAINAQRYYSVEDFEKDCLTYINAIESGRMMCSIHSVAKSGMSRVLSFHSCEHYTDQNRYSFRQYYSLFSSLGYTESGNGFRVSGCGMDMIFHTNYSIMHTLCMLEIITKEECEHLCQQTPIVL
jgi:hypothetical protein